MPWSGATERAAIVAAAAAALAVCACARPSQPPGATEENRPPAVRSLHPRMDSVLAEMSGRAKVQFDEPIQGASGLERQIRASPAYRYQVSVGHSEISIRPRGGWRPGAVYVLEIPAVMSDLLNNRRREPIRMVFSTGPPIVPTAVRARLFDRVTGEELTEGRILYLAAGRDTAPTAADTVPYTAAADSAGRYVLRHVPPGRYWAYGFVDRNRNRRLDRRLEPYDSARVTLEGDSAEASVTLSVLEPDSTPPRLGGVETPDSVTVRLGFDDRLRPGQPLAGLAVRRGEEAPRVPVREARVLVAEDTVPRDTSASVPGDTAAAGRADTATGLDAAAAASDTPAAAEAGGAPEEDPSAGPGEAVPAREETGGGAREPLRGEGAEADSLARPPGAREDSAPADRPPRPTRIVRIRLGEAMSAGETLRVRIDTVWNVWGLAAAADTSFVFVPPPDTAGAGPSGTGGDADTASVAADSAAPDTAAGSAPPDSSADPGGTIP